MCSVATAATDTCTAPSAEPSRNDTATSARRAPATRRPCRSAASASLAAAGSESVNPMVPTQATSPSTAMAARAELAAITTASNSGPPNTASSCAIGRQAEGGRPGDRIDGAPPLGAHRLGDGRQRESAQQREDVEPPGWSPEAATASAHNASRVPQAACRPARAVCPAGRGLVPERDGATQTPSANAAAATPPAASEPVAPCTTSAMPTATVWVTWATTLPRSTADCRSRAGRRTPTRLPSGQPR